MELLRKDNKHGVTTQQGPQDRPVSASPDHCLTHGYPQMLLVFFTSLLSFIQSKQCWSHWDMPTGIFWRSGLELLLLTKEPQLRAAMLWGSAMVPATPPDLQHKEKNANSYTLHTDIFIYDTLFIYLSRKLQGIFWRHYPTAIAACTQSYGLTYSRITSKSIFSPAIFYLPVWFKCFLCWDIYIL